MMKNVRSPFRRLSDTNSDRRGSILVLAAVLLMVIFAFVAFTVDIGYISLNKAQLQAAADAAAMGSALKLSTGLSPNGINADEIALIGRQAASEVAAANRTSDLESLYCDTQSDVRFGQFVWDPDTGTITESWGIWPYNAVEVTLRRQEGGAGANGPLNLFVAPMLGHDTASLQATAVAGLLPGTSFRPRPGEYSPVLPIGYDLDSWNYFELLGGSDPVARAEAPLGIQPSNSLLNATFATHYGETMFTIARLSRSNTDPGHSPFLLVGNTNGNGGGGGEEVNYGYGFAEDNYSYDPDTGQITTGSDGYLEIDLYPGTADMPPGNRGALEFGPSGASNLARQIRYGFNETDLQSYGGQLRFDNGPLSVDGNPGLKDSIKDDLEYIKGKTVALPIYSEVVDNGSNATYTIVKMVPIRILYVDLTGNNKHVTVQPAGALIDKTVVPSDVSVEDAYFFTPIRILK